MQEQFGINKSNLNVILMIYDVENEMMKLEEFMERWNKFFKYDPLEYIIETPPVKC